MATVTLLALGALSLPAYTASAAAPTADPGPVGGLLHQVTGPVKPVVAPLLEQLPAVNINNVGRRL
ncbi:hypothetical protein ABT063_26710 [Streptomyces sp. NPDC002838]|uniref:hypothetical protein n=1 Tax=Streptomyces sp. NPDC002838 TaxID=3154436 RepID=UPI00331BA630